MGYLDQGLGQEAPDAANRSRSAPGSSQDAEARRAEEAGYRSEAVCLGTEEAGVLKGSSRRVSQYGQQLWSPCLYCLDCP